ncbi:hypothetical protein [Brevibacterium sp.]|uniref:hypothetical protein n=1 Tax=Brevibacterium sp. TaxID=1701 RepID=UPI002810CD57|nr:hypothetical protein [Brevibacterium sp.]
MSDPKQHPSHEHEHEHEHEYVPGDFTSPELEDDESIAPRPEEEVADALRTESDVDESREAGD